MKYLQKGMITIRNLDEIREEVLKADGSVYPGSSVVDYINRPSYEASKGNVLDYILDIQKASLVMLLKQKILPREGAISLATALQHFPSDELRSKAFDRDYAEDMFFAVEKKLGDVAGGSASNLHLGRSRNDMMRTVNKMQVREQFLEMCHRLTDLIEVLLAMAKQHADTLMPGYTHTQQAQPLTLGHYLLGLVEMLRRDIARLKNEFNTIQLCPMGAGALTTSSFPIDRQLLCDLLGFDHVMTNSYDAVCSGDFLTGTAAAVSVLCGDIGRFVMHLHVWSAVEYDVLKPGRAYIGISSMMPQKRNPSTLEHIRVGLSECLGKAMAVQVMNHNCQFEGNIDIVDSSVVLCELIENASRNILLLRNICATMDFDKDLLRRKTQNSFTVMTDFADFLVQREHIEYRQAHAAASKVVDICLSTGKTLRDLDEAIINDAFMTVTGRKPSFGFDEARTALDAAACAEKHDVNGGTSQRAIAEMLAEQCDEHEKDRLWLCEVDNQLHEKKSLLSNMICNVNTSMS